MIKSKKCFYFSRFRLSPDGNGGDRRAVQIYRSLEKFEPKFFSYRDTRSVSPWWKYSLFQYKYRFWNKQMQADLYLRENADRYWSRQLDIWPSLAVIDDPIFFQSLVRRLKKNHDTFILAVCHNIESLARGQVVQKVQRKELKKELAVLKKCDLVVTISDADAQFLKKMNINAVHYPYYPVSEVVEWLNLIRQVRAKTTKRHFVFLGTAHNLSTFDGMREFIHAFERFEFRSRGEKLFIAGFGTEPLHSCAADKNIEVLGTLSKKDLYELLTTVKACICYKKPPNTGALTRIEEMLIAGVPVVANMLAIQSYQSRKGVAIFYTWQELRNFIVDFRSPEYIPIPASPDKEQLMAVIEAARSGCKKIF